MIGSPGLRDWAFCFAVFLMLLALFQGFRPQSPGLAVLEGLVSALFWLLSAGLPTYCAKARDNPDLIAGINAIAAGASGGALMASTGHGWSALF